VRRGSGERRAGDAPERVRRRPLLAIAHRAGNDLATFHEALDAGVDLVELDVHHTRRALEVRHSKTLGPHLLWDRWELARRRDVDLPSLAVMLGALDGHARLMIDLKGLHRGLAPAVAALLRETVPGLPVVVCTRHWSMLRAFAGDANVRLVPTVGSRRQLRTLLRLLRRRPVPWPGGRHAFAVCVRRPLLTPSIVDELRRGAGRVLTWPVDTPAELDDARRLGVTGVISKNLPLLREVVADS
jgi:glycerophosphoryl diester phosphodiesterase